MKITKIKKASTHSAKLDLAQFTKDLRSLSEHHNLKLVSFGAMATPDENGTIYLAMWSTEPNAVNQTTAG